MTTSAASAGSSDLPAALGKYRVLTRLGYGGMAEVLLAQQPGPEGFSRLVCIKRVLPQMMADPISIAMFREEAKTCMSLRHPNIVEMLDYVEEGVHGLMVTEYVHGADLAKTLKAMRQRQQRLPVPLSVYVTWCVARALAHTHGARYLDGVPMNLVHRDVSPGNVLLRDDGMVKLADFGIARANRRRSLTMPGAVKGKVPYMAPEVIVNGVVDQRADVFAAGILLWECLTGEELFVAPTDYEAAARVVAAPVDKPSSIHASVPPILDSICQQALARDPERRFQNAKELEQALYPLVGAHHPDALAEQLAAVLTTHVIIPPLARLVGAGVGASLDETLAPELEPTLMVDGRAPFQVLKPESDDFFLLQEEAHPADAASSWMGQTVRVDDSRLQQLLRASREKEAAAGVRPVVLDWADALKL